MRSGPSKSDQFLRHADLSVETITEGNADCTNSSVQKFWTCDFKADKVKAKTPEQRAHRHKLKLQLFAFTADALFPWCVSVCVCARMSA